MSQGIPLVTRGMIVPKRKSPLSNGKIELEMGWQLCAIPILFGYWSIVEHKHIHDGTVAKFKNYVMDQIDDLYGNGLISVANTFTGDNQFYYNYIPNITPDNSTHNFNLIYNDGVANEVMGFWIKSLSPTPLMISWG